MQPVLRDSLKTTIAVATISNPYGMSATYLLLLNVNLICFGAVEKAILDLVATANLDLTALTA
jgi:TRAP-type mannitol/chloroaromatic compound transport system permease small subunit